MQKIATIILIILIIFGIAALISYFLAKEQFKGSNLSFTQEDFSQFKSLISEKKEPNELQHKEYITPDKKLRLEYFSDWKEIEDEKFLEEIVSKETAEKYNLRTLFLAGKLRENGISQLIVSEGEFNIGENLEGVINIMEEINQKEGWEMEIIELENKNSEIIFEAMYKKIEHSELHSKEKMILPDQKEKKVYIVAFITFDKDWQELEEEANNIIDSVKLVD